MAVTAATLRLEDQLKAGLIGVTDAQTRDLVRAWATAWDEIAPDLRDALSDMLVTADGAAITRSQLLRAQRLRQSLALIADRLKELADASGVRITRDLRAIVDAAGGAQASIIDSQLPRNAPQLVDGWSMIDERQITAIVERSTQQVTALHKPLSAEAYGNVRRELIRGIAAGSNPRATASRIIRRTEGGFNGGLNRALTIARTETLDAHRAAAQLGQAQHPDVVAGWQWAAGFSERTCPACLAMDGTIHAATESGPDGHQNCRCGRLVVTKTWAELGFEGIEEPPSVFPDAQEWFGQQDRATQLSIMGEQRLSLLDAGTIGWEDLATLRKTDAWRDSWVPTPVAALVAKSAAA